MILVALMGTFSVLGAGAFFILAVGVVLAAQFELLDAVTRKGHRPNIPLALMCGLAMLSVAWEGRFAYLAVVVAVSTIGFFLYGLRPARGSSPSSDIAWSLLSVVWVAGGGSGATAILAMEPGGLALLVAMVLVTALDDIGAYFGGTRLGRHKMAPSISPAKSWEGFVCGLITALAGGALFGSVLSELTLVEGVGLGALCGLLAPVGDLVESMFKRELGIKDSGHILPGHGGFLDRLDAIIFCAPAAALYLRVVAG